MSWIFVLYFVFGVVVVFGGRGCFLVEVWICKVGVLVGFG